jgi:hypothetical protein
MKRHLLLGLLFVSTSAAADMLALFDRLRSATPNEQVSFQLTESEVNDYMVEALKKTPRPGVDAVKVKFFPNNYASTYTWSTSTPWSTGNQEQFHRC